MSQLIWLGFCTGCILSLIHIVWKATLSKLMKGLFRKFKGEVFPLLGTNEAKRYHFLVVYWLFWLLINFIVLIYVLGNLLALNQRIMQSTLFKEFLITVWGILRQGLLGNKAQSKVLSWSTRVYFLRVCLAERLMLSGHVLLFGQILHESLLLINNIN